MFAHLMKLKNALVLSMGLGFALAGCANTALDAPQTSAEAAPPVVEGSTEAAEAALPVEGAVATESAAPAEVDPVVPYLDRARSAMETSGGEETARQIYREAISAFPTDKRPWLGLAQSYFELSDYGNAVLAAQEVVQRDPDDEVAHGILAISGLRVATIALGSIRESGDINDAARREAEIMSRNLNVLFGARDNNRNGAAQDSAASSANVVREVVVPRRAQAPATPPRAAQRTARSRPQAPAAAAPAPVRRPAPAAAPAAPSNPFGALR